MSWPSGSDPFYLANIEENNARRSYYSVNVVPKFIIDGTFDAGSGYSAYQTHLENQMTVPSPLEIDISLDYTPGRGTGTVYTEITATDTIDYTNLKIRYAVIEDSIYLVSPNGHNWHHQTMRDLFPNANGVSLDIAFGETVYDTQDFDISGDWDDAQCSIVAFVQSDNGRQVLQAAQAYIVTFPVISFDKYNTDDSAGGDGDGLPEAGEDVDLTVYVKNVGRSEANTVDATLSSSDPVVTVTQPSVSYGSIDVGVSVPSDPPFEVHIDDTCPDPYITWLTLDIDVNSGAYTFQDSFPFMASSEFGLKDDMESGEGEWTHSGTFDYWHLTEYKYNSETHSWYNGWEDNWIYFNNMDTYLESPWVMMEPGAQLWFHTWYQIEYNFDFGFVEIFNGKKWVNLDSFTGASGWTQMQYDLSDYSGTPLKLRFHFVSDAGAWAEGWYIDDIVFGHQFPVQEEPIEGSPVERLELALTGTILHEGTDVLLSLPEERFVTLSVYDATGRVVNQIFEGTLDEGSHRLIWSGRDARGLRLSDGVYFIAVNDGTETQTRKAVIVR
jgi:hypothetical protein